MAWQATGGNLKGPKGDNGADGAKGDAGKSLHVANITVSDNSDVSVAALSPATPIATGDLISDVDGRLFTVSSVVNGDTVHVSNQIAGVTFKGPKGDKGEDGKPGADGKDGTGVNIKGSYDSPDALKQEHPTRSIRRRLPRRGRTVRVVRLGMDECRLDSRPAGAEGRGWHEWSGWQARQGRY